MARIKSIKKKPFQYGKAFFLKIDYKNTSF